VVQLIDTSTNTPTSWGWNATNADNSTRIQFSTSQNPVQTFDAGNWSVVLTAANAYGSDDSDPTWINVTEGGGVVAPVAMFSTNKTVVVFVQWVGFTDTSTNTPTAYNWSFGDGTYSNLQNPAHQFLHRGRWIVVENVSNSAGYSTNTTTIWSLGG
jgi:PKD repeat protein